MLQRFWFGVTLIFMLAYARALCCFMLLHLGSPGLSWPCFLDQHKASIKTIHDLGRGGRPGVGRRTRDGGGSTRAVCSCEDTVRQHKDHPRSLSSHGGGGGRRRWEEEAGGGVKGRLCLHA